MSSAIGSNGRVFGIGGLDPRPHCAPDRRKRERHRSSCICGNHMNFGGASSAGPPDGLRAVFFRAPVPSGCTFTMVLSMDTASIRMDDLLPLQPLEDPLQHAGLGPAAHPRVDRMPVAKPLWQAPPLATMLRHVKHGVEHFQIGELDVAALRWQTMLDPLILFCTDFHGCIISCQSHLC